MARYVVTVHTPMAPDQAFGFLADLRRFPEWDPGVSRVIRVQGETGEVGATYDVTIAGRWPTVMRYVVTESDPPRSVRCVATTRWLRSDDRITVEPTATGAAVNYDAVLTLRGPLGLLDPLLARAFRGIGDRAAAGLRAALAAS